MKLLEKKRKLPPLTEEQERRLQEGAARKLALANAQLATVNLEQLNRLLDGEK